MTASITPVTPVDVWREACRPAKHDDWMDRIARQVADALPADLLVLRRIDIERLRVETVRVGSAQPAAADGPHLERARTDCSPAQLQELLAWCRGGGVRRGSLGSDPLLALLAPAGAAGASRGSGAAIAGALLDDGQPIGALVALARPPRALGPEHEPALAALLEPLAIALATDSRLHELARLREALEADKRALLSRLDRQDVADAIVGSDAGLRVVMDRVQQVAPTDVPVLLLGETGTGKEVIARAIHARSRRARGPVVRVNCGALPPGLVDSELFGHERGSFTGAVGTRKGMFERADGGTLFLDEIGELPLEAQVRLLRILQDGTFERVGGHQTLSVDVRVVAATHRDLRAMVARGTFREDLWYRVSVFPIRLPMLRERIEDIPALAAHFAWRAGKRLGGTPLAPTPDDLELLVTYPWPGNVRELAAVIERAAILGDGRRLDVAAALGVAPPAAQAAQAAHAVAADNSSGAPAASRADEPVVPLDLAMARHIERALADRRGRIEGPHGAAALLGINPHTLRARMRKLGIAWGKYREG